MFGQTLARKVEEKSVVNALTSPLSVGNLRLDGSRQFIGEHATVVVNDYTGKIVTVWPTDKKKAERLKRKQS